MLVLVLIVLGGGGRRQDGQRHARVVRGGQLFLRGEQPGGTAVAATVTSAGPAQHELPRVVEGRAAARGNHNQPQGVPALGPAGGDLGRVGGVGGVVRVEDAELPGRRVRAAGLLQEDGVGGVAAERGGDAVHERLHDDGEWECVDTRGEPHCLHGGGYARVCHGGGTHKQQPGGEHAMHICVEKIVNYSSVGSAIVAVRIVSALLFSVNNMQL